MSIGIGRREGIRPADIVGSIANEADVPGREIGPIDIQDDVTYVGIPERYVEAVIAKVGKKRFRGKALNIRVAPPMRDDAPRRRPSPPSFESKRFESKRFEPKRFDAKRPDSKRPDAKRSDSPRFEPRKPGKPFDRFAKKKPRS